MLRSHIRGVKTSTARNVRIAIRKLQAATSDDTDHLFLDFGDQRSEREGMGIAIHRPGEKAFLDVVAAQAQAEFERDYALQQQLKLEALNSELRRKVEEIETLQAALREQAVRASYALSMVLVDLDNFKNINDTLGHNFGDQVRVTLAALQRHRIRNSDLAMRYGGEEFCLVFPVSSAEDTKLRMNNLLARFSDASIIFGDKALTGLTFSAGIAQLFVHGTTAEELLLMADSALCRAKNESRSRVLVPEQPFS
jgi:diguanylate cyclase (GGDEF)-like protein